MVIESVKAYIDGSTVPTNPGYGGWGLYLEGDEDSAISLSGEYDFPSTNNQMEMQAFIEALKYLGTLDPSVVLQIHCDSKYVVEGHNTWMANWKINNWKKGKLINLDKWKEIDELSMALKGKFTLEWVKGHANCYGNKVADKLANSAARRSYSNKLN